MDHYNGIISGIKEEDMKQENRKQEDKKQFLFGAVYIIEQDYTQEEIRRDLSQMQEYGCNLITLCRWETHGWQRILMSGYLIRPEWYWMSVKSWV